MAIAEWRDRPLRHFVGLDAIPTPILLFEGDITIAANAAALDDLGKTSVEVLGTGFAAHLHDDDAGKLADLLVLARQGGPARVMLRWGCQSPPRVFEARAQRGGGTRLVVSLTEMVDAGAATERMQELHAR